MSGIVLHSGWLTKCSGSHKNWKRRFFRLLARSHSTPPRLSYYRNEVSTEPLGNIAIERCRPIQPATSPVARKYCIIAETPSRTYELIAETAEDLDAWMHHIKSVQNPSVAPPGTDERHCICEGWLTKQGGRVKSWKRRWFMLRDTFLLYFKSDKQATAIGHVDLTLSTAVYGAMQAQLPQFPFAFEIPTTERVYLFACSRREDLDYWLDGIYRALQQHRDREEREREQMQKRMERRTVECTQKSQTARLSDLEAEILMLGGQQRGSVMTLSESSMPRLNSLAHALSSGTGSDTDEDESAGAYSAAYGSRPMPSPGAGAAPPPPLSGTSSSRRTSAVHTYETRPAYEPAYDEASSTYSDASFHPLLAPPTRPPPNTPGNDDVDAEATLQREKNDARDYDYGDPRYYAKIDVDRAMKHQSAHFPQYDEEFDHDEEEDDDTVSLAPSTSTSIHLSSAAPPPPPARRVIPRPPEERLVDTPRNTGQPRSSDLYAYQRQQHKLKQEAQATGSPSHDGDDVYVEVDPVADEGDYGSVHGGSDYDYADPSNAAPAPAPAPSRNKPMPKQQSLRVIAESAPSPPQRSSSFVTTARTNLSSAKPPPALPPSRRR